MENKVTIPPLVISCLVISSLIIILVGTEGGNTVRVDYDACHINSPPVPSANAGDE